MLDVGCCNDVGLDWMDGWMDSESGRGGAVSGPVGPVSGVFWGSWGGLFGEVSKASKASRKSLLSDPFWPKIASLARLTRSLVGQTPSGVCDPTPKDAALSLAGGRADLQTKKLQMGIREKRGLTTDH